MKAAVSHFEIPADDVNRAKEFYKNAFGWKMVDVPDMDYSMVHTVETDKDGMTKELGAINGGMMKRTPEVEHPVITIVVDDIDEAIKKVKDLGGEITVDRLPVGDFGFSAYFKDSEGNLMGLYQSRSRQP